MEYIVENDCTDSNLILQSDAIALEFVKILLDDITSVKKLVITDTNFDNYKKSVTKHSVNLVEHIELTESSGVGVVINALNLNGQLEQYIFLKGNVFLCFCNYFYFIDKRNSSVSVSEIEGIDKLKESANRSFIYVMHEIGHAIDHQNIYSKHRYFPIRVQYGLPSQLNEFAKHEMVTIWSEYFAERFAYSKAQTLYFVPSTYEIVELLKNNATEGIIKDVKKTYRLLYWYVLDTAYYHTVHQENCFYCENTLNEYEGVIELLRKLEHDLKYMYTNISNLQFESEINKLRDIFLDIYNIMYDN